MGIKLCYSNHHHGYILPAWGLFSYFVLFFCVMGGHGVTVCGYNLIIQGNSDWLAICMANYFYNIWIMGIYYH